MPEEFVCFCNEVPEKEIVELIRSGKGKTLQDVSRQTKAGTGCGRCRRLIRNIIKRELEKE